MNGMSITGFLYARYRRALSLLVKRRILAQHGSDRLDPADWAHSLEDPTEFYFTAFRFFHRSLPSAVREHRAYFDRDRRGFGEDAMHAMWFVLFRELKPRNFLEVGVYRGQVISLATLLSGLNGHACQVYGISPFSAVGDSVSKYRDDIKDYREDTLAHFRHFSLPAPSLVKALSTDEAALALIRSVSWEMIYLDGSHDYEVVSKDWEVCSQNLVAGGIIVLDDAGLTTTFKPPIFASAGHPGPSRVAKEIDRAQFREILQVGHNRVFQKV